MLRVERRLPGAKESVRWESRGILVIGSGGGGGIGMLVLDGGASRVAGGGRRGEGFGGSTVFCVEETVE